MRGLYFTVFFNALVVALPQVAYPFNSQVPPVARVAETYQFQFAATTFVSDDGSSLSYTLTGAPAWLGLNSATRTLYGTPEKGDTGPNAFEITATGSGGSMGMSCTLVVASNSAPAISGDITDDLARSGPLSGPTTLLLDPSDAFAISFSKDVFQDSPGRIQAYYATMSDHTPLPSWLKFESNDLTFWGMTPVLATGSQTFVVDLIASDVVGFAGAIATFTLLISNNQLAFSPQTENLTVTVGEPINLGSLRDQLYLNGKRLPEGTFRNATGKLPSWLTFQNDTLELKGTPPHGFRDQTVTISVTDDYGDTAVKSINLHAGNISLFDGEIGNLTATVGKPFAYAIEQSVFSQKGLNVSVDVGSASSWLNFDSSKLQLQGTPPIDTQASNITASLVASSTSTTDSQNFVIQLKAAITGAASTTSSSTSQTSPTNTSTSSSSATPTAAASKKDNKAGIIVGIVIGCLAVLALFFAIAMLMCRRRRRAPHQKGRPPISRPILPYSDQEPIMSPDAQEHDLEKACGSPVKHSPDEPPRLEIDLAMSSQTPVRVRSALVVRQLGKSRLSMVSSLGDAEATIRADSNIPIWGRQSGTTHTPHDSYSAATVLARQSSLARQNSQAQQNSRASNHRLSALAKFSPTKRASRIRDSWQSHNSIGLGLNVHGSVIHRPKRRSRMNSSVFSFSRDRSSCASLNTHGTSLLSTKPTDFPNPLSNRNSRTVPAFSLTEAEKHRSIRVVSQTDSIADARPLAEKRQSFIRNRASSSIVSPLFASSRRSSNLGLYSSMGSLNGRNTSIRKPTRHRSLRTTFSASSSIEPPIRNPRRLASGTVSFKPSFPRAILASPVRDNNDTVPVAATGDSDLSTTTSATSNSLPFSLSEDANTAAEYISELPLPRHERNWVLPGEASPTPPPPSSSKPRTQREAARRKWANRLNRNSQGDLVSRSPSPLRCQLSGVSTQGLRCRKERLQDNDKENRHHHHEDTLSKLVSSDSLNGVLGSHGRHSVLINAQRISSSKARIEDFGTDTMGGAQEKIDDEADWEDVVVVVTASPGNRRVGFRDGVPLTRSSVSGSSGSKMFI